MLSLRERMQQNLVGDFKKFRFDPVELPDLEAEMTPLGRMYVTPDGNKYPSITTVLSILSKDAIAKWRKKVGEEEANRISTYASERGTRVHQICEDYIANRVDKFKNLEYADLQTFKAIKPILDQNVDDILIQEVALYSDRLKVAGRTDVIGNYKGTLSIIDFKTSLKPKKKEWIGNYFQQGAGYATMWEERTGRPIEQIVIIISPDKGDPQVFVEKRDDHIQDFINTRKLYQEIHNV